MKTSNAIYSILERPIEYQEFIKLVGSFENLSTFAFKGDILHINMVIMENGSENEGYLSISSYYRIISSIKSTHHRNDVKHFRKSFNPKIFYRHELNFPSRRRILLDRYDPSICSLDRYKKSVENFLGGELDFILKRLSKYNRQTQKLFYLCNRSSDKIKMIDPYCSIEEHLQYILYRLKKRDNSYISEIFNNIRFNEDEDEEDSFFYYIERRTFIKQHHYLCLTDILFIASRYNRNKLKEIIQRVNNHPHNNSIFDVVYLSELYVKGLLPRLEFKNYFGLTDADMIEIEP